MRICKRLECLTFLFLVGSALASDRWDVDSLSAAKTGASRIGSEEPMPAQRDAFPISQSDLGAQVDRLKGKTFTLVELVEWALHHSDLVISNRARVEDRRHAAHQARIRPNPSLDFSVGRRQEFPSSGPLYELALVQPLILFGKQQLRGNLLDLESEAWRIRQAAAEIGVTLDVIRLGHEYATQRRIVDLIEARQQRFDLFRSYVAGHVFASPQQKAQSRLVEQRLKRLTADALEARAALRATFEKLGAFVNFDVEPFPEIEIPWYAGSGVLDEQEEETRALTHNPDLTVQRISLKSAAVERILAIREALPDLSVVAFYGSGTASVTERNVGVGLSVSLPLWNRNEAGIKSSEQRGLAEERLLAFKEKQLRAELRKVLAEYEAARRVVEQYPHSLLAELEEQLIATEEEFRKGRVDILTFLELDSEFWDTSSRVCEAQSTLATKIIDLMALNGERTPLARLGSL